METPNAANATTGSGKTAEQAEFDNGAALKRAGKGLPANASDAARRGYDSTESAPGDDNATTPGEPGTAREDETKMLVSHRVAPQAQTDRPEPTTLPSDAEDLNPNDKVSITKDEPGKRYNIEGRGSSTVIDFENDVTAESLIAVTIDHLEGGAGDAGVTDNFSRNAVKELRQALEWLQNGTRDRLKRFGVTSGGVSPLAGGTEDRLQRG